MRRLKEEDLRMKLETAAAVQASKRFRLENDDLKNSINEVNAKVVSLTNTLKDADDNIVKLTATVIDTNKQLREAKNEEKHHRKEIAELRDEVNEWMIKANKKHSESSDFAHSDQSFQIYTMSKIHSEAIKEADKKLFELSQELNALNDSHKLDVLSFEKKIHKLESHVESLELTIASNQEDNNTLRSDISTFGDTKKSMESELADARIALQLMGEELNVLKKFKENECERYACLMHHIKISQLLNFCSK